LDTLMMHEADAPTPLDWRTLDLFGKSAIEASAGTGKTYTLVLLVLRILLERELPAGAILLATFSEAATAELRLRVRERLQQAYAAALPAGDARYLALAGDDPLAAYFAVRWQPGRAGAKLGVRQRDASLLWRALNQLDEMTIRTLHGFARQILSSFNLTATDPDRPIADGDTITTAAIDDAIRRRFADVASLSPILLDALDEGFLAQLRRGVERALRYGRITLRAPARVANAQYQRIRNVLFTQQFRAELIEVLARPPDDLKLLAVAKRAVETLLRAFKAGPLQALPSGALRTFNGEKSAQFKTAGRALSTHPALKNLTQFAGLHSMAARGEFAHLLNELVLEVRSARAESLASQGIQSFDSMMETLADQLAPVNADVANMPVAQTLCAAIHERYPVALIDEFQDTDAQAWAILRAIYGTRGGLVLVGDPKQSIYRFRGSDVHTFVRAAQICQRFYLRENYRSSTTLLAGLNRFYAAVPAPFHSHEVRYRSAVSGRADLTPAAEIAAPLVFFELQSEGLARADLALCLRTASADIAQLLAASQTANPKVAVPRIAMLVARNKDVRAASEYLAKSAVAVFASASFGVYQSPAAAILLTVLDAISHPNDVARAHTAYVARMQTSAATAHNVDRQALLGAFDLLAQNMQARGVAYICLNLAPQNPFEQSDVSQIDRDQFDRDAAHLAELIAVEEQALFAKQPKRASGESAWPEFHLHVKKLAGILRARIQVFDDRADSGQRRRSGAGACVQVMTIHKAKGLEFDHVFLPTLYFARTPDRQIAIIPGADGLECDAGSTHFDLAIAAEADEALGELLRQQYVALTRAKTSVRVYFCSTLMQKSSALSWHLAKILTPDAPDESPGERAWADQINAAPSDVESPKNVSVFANEPWRAGLLQLACHAEIDCILRTNIGPENADASAPVVLSRHHALTVQSTGYRSASELPSLRPSRRRISFSTLTYAGSDDFANTKLSSIGCDTVDKSREGDTADEYASMAADRPDAANAPLILADPELTVLEAFKGANFGSALHALFEDAMDRLAPIGRDAVMMRCHEFGVLPAITQESDAQAIVDLILRNRAAPLLPGLRLADLNRGNCIAELGFQLPVAGLLPEALAQLGPRFGLPTLFVSSHGLARIEGMLVGFIDLIFQLGEKFYLLDYKSNWLGPLLSDYQPHELELAMAEHQYHLQHLLYALALHRYLRASLVNYDYETHFGGAHYLFIRAFGLQHPAISAAEFSPQIAQYGHYQYRAPLALIDALDQLFADSAGA
jgi:exodeoxyribonuclease V beta subunit